MTTSITYCITAASEYGSSCFIVGFDTKLYGFQIIHTLLNPAKMK